MIDVVIVGGSLAGTATAIHLAERGHEVVILDRSVDGRRKACGEGLFPRGVEELHRLGVLPSAAPFGAPLDGVRFHAGRYTAAAPFGGDAGRALGVRRSDLDPLLRERSVRAGVDVRMGTAVRGLVPREGGAGPGFTGVVTDSGAVVHARVVVGADGLRSRVRREAALDVASRTARYGVSAHLQLPDAPAPFVDIHFRPGIEIYVTPVGDATVNVAMLLGRAGMRRFAGRMTEAFEALLGAEPTLARGVLLDQPVATGPFPARSRRPWRDNLVLVGDAAGFFDAITGEGMSTSLVSARYCAQAVSDYLERGDASAFRQYAAQRRALVRNSDLLGRVSLALSSRPALARHSVRNMMRRPWTFRRLVGVSSGELCLRDLRPRDLLALAVGL